MAEYERRAMIEAEDKYTFQQSSQISGQCGLIGYLRADFDTDGNGFFSTWNDYRADLKTEEFKQEFDEIINSLREDGDILHDSSELARYCYSTPQSKMTLSTDSYGVRVDTARYAYLLRLNPNKGEYNIYCYCYRRDWLDQHLRQAEKGIRFIDPQYKELFRIPDGDRIRVTLSDGEHRDRTVRYIDDYHIELSWENGSSLYHICEFAERVASSGANVIPLRSSLPDHCYVFIETESEIGMIRKGDSGYYRTDLSVRDNEDGRSYVNNLNQKLGVSKAQAEAMKAGSMFGWSVPAADPAHYDAQGRAIKPKYYDRRNDR